MSSSSSSTDPAAAITDAWRRARDAFSFSSVRGHEVTSTHTLHISKYSTIDSILPHGKCVKSKPFRAGGHRWQLEYYPNGYTKSKTGGPTAVLNLMENRFLGRAADATATYNVSILDVDGNVVKRRAEPGKPWLHTLRGSKGGYTGIWADIVEDATTQTPEEQKKALRQLKEDSLVVRCDVTVQSLKEESRAKWFLRRFLQ
ncbi:unnamed protein product [Urochloa humidicola]